MKKCYLAALVLVLLLTGCHGRVVQRPTGEDLIQETDPVSDFYLPETFDEGKHHTISFWAKNDSNKNQVAVYQKAVRDFEALYPNVKVELKLYTDYSRIYNDVITNIATHTTPDVCITYPDHIATYLTGEDVVMPLENLIGDARFGLHGSSLKFEAPGDLVPAFLQECRVDGLTYALPYMRSTEICYVNKTYVEKLGFSLPEVLSWDFIWQVCDAAAQKGPDGNYLVNGQKVLIPFLYKSTDNMMIQMLRQLDAPYSSAQGDTLLFNPTTRSLLDTIQAQTAKGNFSTFKISGYPANFLNAGQCIFAVDSSAGATWMGWDAPLMDIAPDAIVRAETAVRPVPQFDPQHPQMISQGPSLCLFRKSDPQQELAAWLFAQFLLTDEVQLAYAKTEGYVPVTQKAQASSSYQDYLLRAGEDAEHYGVKIAACQVLLQNQENTFVTPVFNGSASLRSAAGQLIEEVVKSTRRKQPVDDKYHEALTEKMISLYRLSPPPLGAEQMESTPAGAPPAFGPLEPTAKVLLGGLAVSWAGILGYVLFSLLKARKKGSSKI